MLYLTQAVLMILKMKQDLDVVIKRALGLTLL